MARCLDVPGDVDDRHRTTAGTRTIERRKCLCGEMILALEAAAHVRTHYSVVVLEFLVFDSGAFPGANGPIGRWLSVSSPMTQP
jgi:hypothetical protein